MRTMRTAVAYIRVSKEKDDMVSPDTQLAKIRQYCQLHDLVLADVYRDIDLSGRTDERPAFQELIRRIQQGGIDMVLVYKLDRFARSVKDFHSYMQVLDRHNCHLVSVSQNIDTSSPVGRLMRNVLVDFAQFESEMIGERLRDAVRHVVATKGKYVSGKPPFGYRRREDGTLEIDEDQAHIVRWIYEQYAQGKGTRALALEMTRLVGPTFKGTPYWRANVINGILRNRAYLGEAKWGSTVRPHSHPAIIDEALWERVQVLMAQRSVPKGGAPHTRALSGLLRCGLCGTRAEASSWYRHQVRWRCATKEWSPARCQNVLLDELSTLYVLREILVARLDPQAVYQAEVSVPLGGQQPSEAEQLRRRIQKLKAILDELFADHYERGILTKEQFAQLHRRYMEEYQASQQRLAELQEGGHELSALDIEAMRAALLDIRDDWEEMTQGEKRLVLGQVVREAIWWPDRLEVHLHGGHIETAPYVWVKKGTAYLTDKLRPVCEICRKHVFNLGVHIRAAHGPRKNGKIT